jgi:hypothetical protein
VAVAVATATRWPARQALTEMATAKVALAGAGRAQQEDVLLAVQEVQLAELLDHLLLDRALKGEVELLERLG